MLHGAAHYGEHKVHFEALLGNLVVSGIGLCLVALFLHMMIFVTCSWPGYEQLVSSPHACGLTDHRQLCYGKYQQSCRYHCGCQNLQKLMGHLSAALTRRFKGLTLHARTSRSGDLIKQNVRLRRQAS